MRDTIKKYLLSFSVDVLVDLLWLYHAVAGVALYFSLNSFMHFSNRFYRTSYELLEFCNATNETGSRVIS
jgi:hypothetical protein